MTRFTATVPGDPRGKGSVRVHKGHAFKDARTAEYMTRAILAFQAARGTWSRLDGPWWCELAAFIERPKHLVPKPRARTPQPPTGAFVAPCKPDADNIAKAILDALVQAGIVADDCSCVDLSIRKFYAPVGSPACVSVTLGPVEPWTLSTYDVPDR